MATDWPVHLEVWNLLNVEELALIILAGGLEQIPQAIANRRPRVADAFAWIELQGRLSQAGKFSLMPVSVRRQIRFNGSGKIAG
jgi:hypothetical protein